MNIDIVKKLLPNTLEGLKWGLTHFDGVEFDIRLSGQRSLVIHHDPITVDDKLISSMKNSDLKANNLFLLEELLMDKDIISSLKNGKYLWIELKPNCEGKKNKSRLIADKLYSQLINELDNTKFPKKNIRILSFSKDLLDPVAQDNELKAYPILPYINECNMKFVLFKALPRVIYRSLKSHLEECVRKNYKGVLFARQYILGPLALRHPSYEKLTELMSQMDLELGSNLGKVELESEFPLFHRFSDKTDKYPRLAKKGEGQIIAHRGTGTKGVLIPNNEET
ncbi:MAG: hypothetical protein HeimC2_44250 [Candidatus Heimdallarchaeota archaeon LC_2]|nr:MAG: hypothetical protein HeimC2_44250 [Candidatus Heimdallarchaeota archaeon LC_2]